MNNYFSIVTCEVARKTLNILLAKNGPQYSIEIILCGKTHVTLCGTCFANIQRDAQIEFSALSTNVTDNFDVFLGAKYMYSRAKK